MRLKLSFISVSIMVTGHGPLLGNPLTGEPGIWYFTGRLTQSFDAGGNPTPVDLDGTLIDLCSQLAS